MTSRNYITFSTQYVICNQSKDGVTENTAVVHILNKNCGTVWIRIKCGLANIFSSGTKILTTKSRARKILRFLSNISPEAMSASSLAALAAVAIKNLGFQVLSLLFFRNQILAPDSWIVLKHYFAFYGGSVLDYDWQRK